MSAYSENEKKVEVGRKIIADLKKDADGMFRNKGFVKVYYELLSPYKWGRGWTASTDDRARMDSLLHKAMSSMGWEIRPAKYASACDEGWSTARERLYLHPMEVAGELKPKTVAVARAALEKAACESSGMFSIESVQTPYKVYELTLEDLQKFYDKHESEIRALVKNYFSTMLWKQKVNENMFDLYKSFRILERNQDGFISSDEPQIKLFYTIRDKMVEEGHLRVSDYEIEWVG